MIAIAFFLASASLSHGAILRRADPPFQVVPTSAQPDDTFSNGAPMLASEPPQVSSAPIPAEYGARSIDLPFGRLYHGDMKFFSEGELNSPTGITDAWMGQPGVVDSANQSACGIPDNAFSISKVAIHPYFLKYADLSRYCMQDVCISFWNGKQQGQGQSDMILKVTDICSTDPNDPTHCATPGDIKVDRTKVRIMEQIPGNGPLKSIKQVAGNEFKDGVSEASSQTWWFFAKCWADALVQPAYTDNWFAKPALPNNLGWAQGTATQQYMNNQKAYAAKNPPWPTYPNGAYNPAYNDVTSPPISDWSPNDPEPSWCPVAGGKGWGKPTGDCAGGSNQGSSSNQGSGGGSPGGSTNSSVAVPGNGTWSASAPIAPGSLNSSAVSPNSSTGSNALQVLGGSTAGNPDQSTGTQQIVNHGEDEGDDDDTCEF